MEIISLLKMIMDIGSLMGPVHLPYSDAAFDLLDKSGVLGVMVGSERQMKKARALAISGSPAQMSQDFIQGQKCYYLRADIQGRLGAPRVCRAIAARLEQVDPELAVSARIGYSQDGSDGMFRAIRSRVHQIELRSKAALVRGVDAVEQDVIASPNYGRAM